MKSLPLFSVIPEPVSPSKEFQQLYDKHITHLHLQGLREKTIDGYSRAIRRVGAAFDYQIATLSEDQLLDHFSTLLKTHSQSTVKIELYGLRFFYRYVLKRDWVDLPLVKSKRVSRIPDIVTTEEAGQIFAHTQILSYRVFFYTVYSMGLRLSEALKLEVGDIDAARHRVHIRDGKGGKDRFVPLPQVTLLVLRRFWKVHRHPTLLFPNRMRKLEGARFVSSPLDCGSAQRAMREAVKKCGLKKRLPYTAYAIAMPRT